MNKLSSIRKTELLNFENLVQKKFFMENFRKNNFELLLFLTKLYRFLKIASKHKSALEQKKIHIKTCQKEIFERPEMIKKNCSF